MAEQREYKWTTNTTGGDGKYGYATTNPQTGSQKDDKGNTRVG